MEQDMIIKKVEQSIIKDRGWGAPCDEYTLEIAGHKDRWPLIDKMIVTHSWVSRWGGNITRTLTFNFIYKPDNNVDIEIEIQQTRFYMPVPGTDVDFNVRFVLPTRSKDLPEPIKNLIDAVDKGEINYKNLADAIKKVLNDLRKHISSLTREHISIRIR